MKCKDPVGCASALQCLQGCEHEPCAGPSDTVAMVAEFHRAFEYEIPEKPCVSGLDSAASCYLSLIAGHLDEVLVIAKSLTAGHPKKPQCLQRACLILEELMELCEAMSRDDIVACLDSCEDLEYVVAGSIVGLGLASVHHEAFRRVHASNMSKLKDGKVIKDEQNKVVKGDWYKPVDLGDLVK